MVWVAARGSTSHSDAHRPPSSDSSGDQVTRYLKLGPSSCKQLRESRTLGVHTSTVSSRAPTSRRPDHKYVKLARNDVELVVFLVRRALGSTLGAAGGAGGHWDQEYQEFQAGSGKF